MSCQGVALAYGCAGYPASRLLLHIFQPSQTLYELTLRNDQADYLRTMANAEIRTACMQFLARDPIYEKVKPYTLHRSYVTTLPHDNFINESVQHLELHDIRESSHALTFEKNGFTVLEMHSVMTYEDFSNRTKIEDVYCKEVSDVLLAYTGASAVQVFDFAVTHAFASCRSC